MRDYHCPFCGGYLYEQAEQTGKRKYEITKRIGTCMRPGCPPRGSRLDDYPEGED